jgi:hypothetical protein
LDLERGISSKCKSSACVDYVPAVCTHRPSLVVTNGLVNLLDCSAMSGKISEPYHLEQQEVVTRYL